MMAGWCPIFIVQALKGEALTIYGKGDQTRSFCYVDDMVDALMRLMESPDTLTGPVNLGNPSEFSIQQLAETIIDLSGSRSSVIYKDLPQDDPKQRKPDITLAQRELKWSPYTALESGLKRTIAYFDDLLKKTGMN